MQVPDLNNSEEIKKIYENCFKQVHSMVIKNSGSANDAHDVFQEAMLVLYTKWKQGNLELTAHLCTFLQSIARNKWFNELKRLGRITYAEFEKEIADEGAITNEKEKEKKSILLAQCISKLGDKCRDIVQLFLTGTPGEEIAEKLAYSTYEYYRLAKKRCIDKLKELIKNQNSW